MNKSKVFVANVYCKCSIGEKGLMRQKLGLIFGVCWGFQFLIVRNIWVLR